MRRIVCLFLTMSFLSLHAEETNEEIATLDLFSSESSGELVSPAFMKENSMISSATEIVDFKIELPEFSTLALPEEKNPLSSIAESKKNEFYFLLPITGLQGSFAPGFSYRHHSSDTRFLEVSYSSGLGKIDLVKYKGFFEEESRETIGRIYKNIVNVSYGFKWNIRFIQPYLSLGAGIFLPYMQYNETASVHLLPTIGTALGIEFLRYGFVDLAISYLPIKWKTQFKYQYEGHEYANNDTIKILGDFRLGVGFPF